LQKLTAEFYERANVVQIAKDLLGKILVTQIDNLLTSGRIVETEAYVGLTDKASHSYGGKRTARNEAMYGPAGTAYVYICYGMHQLFNVVTNASDMPDAVLIRAVEPMKGIPAMLRRTGKATMDNTLTKGPGNTGKALGLNKDHSGTSLLGNRIYIADDGFVLPPNKLGASKRIGVQYAGQDALLPYRFYEKGNPFVSGSPVR
jgi:DNA-3-methyladenine glycosylase